MIFSYLPTNFEILPHRMEKCGSKKQWAYEVGMSPPDTTSYLSPILIPTPRPPDRPPDPSPPSTDTTIKNLRNDSWPTRLCSGLASRIYVNRILRNTFPEFELLEQPDYCYMAKEKYRRKTNGIYLFITRKNEGLESVFNFNVIGEAIYNNNNTYPSSEASISRIVFDLLINKICSAEKNRIYVVLHDISQDIPETKCIVVKHNALTVKILTEKLPLFTRQNYKEAMNHRSYKLYDLFNDKRTCH